MKSTLILLLCFCIASASSTNDIIAQIPRTISYQGVLANPDGTLIKDGNHSLLLNLYPISTGGTSMYSETQTVPVIRGIFNVIIGSVAAIPDALTFDRAYFLGVAVDGGAELSPRTALTSVPYALNAGRAAVADGLAPNATGVVTSLNEVGGALRLIGAGGTTVTNSGTTFTVSSTVGGSGNGFKLPYSDSAANGTKPIFNVGNTGSTGNTISGIAAGGSGIGGMTSSAIFGDGGVGYNGVTGFSNGGSNMFAGVLGHAKGSSTGIIAIAVGGDGLTATSSTGRAGFFQISNSASSANALEAVSTGNGDAIRGSSPTTGVHGISSSKGVLGESQSASGIGVEARYSGTGVGTALQIDNGAIKVSGQSKAAFVHIATAANIWGASNSATEIDNPLCNGDPTAMVFITHSAPAAAGLPSFTSWWQVVYYDTTRQKWQIYTPAAGGIGIGDQFFVLIVKQ